MLLINLAFGCGSLLVLLTHVADLTEKVPVEVNFQKSYLQYYLGVGVFLS